MLEAGADEDRRAAAAPSWRWAASSRATPRSCAASCPRWTTSSASRTCPSSCRALGARRPARASAEALHPGERRLSSAPRPHVRYLKISEGCDHTCAFCAIPLMRGQHRSRPLDGRGARGAGAGAAGRAGDQPDRAGPRATTAATCPAARGCPTCSRALLAGDGGAVVPAAVRLLRRHHADAGRTCWRPSRGSCPTSTCRSSTPPTGCSRRCAAPSGSGTIRAKVARLREAVPDIALRTTSLVGFPGETDADFRELLEFARRAAVRPRRRLRVLGAGGHAAAAPRRRRARRPQAGAARPSCSSCSAPSRRSGCSETRRPRGGGAGGRPGRAGEPGVASWAAPRGRRTTWTAAPTCGRRTRAARTAPPRALRPARESSRRWTTTSSRSRWRERAPALGLRGRRRGAALVAAGCARAPAAGAAAPGAGGARRHRRGPPAGGFSATGQFRVLSPVATSSRWWTPA